MKENNGVSREGDGGRRQGQNRDQESQGPCGIWSSQSRWQRSEGSHVSRACYSLNASEDNWAPYMLPQDSGRKPSEGGHYQTLETKEEVKVRRDCWWEWRAEIFPPLCICFWPWWQRSLLALESARVSFESRPPPRAGYVVCGTLLAPVSSILIGFL